MAIATSEANLDWMCFWLKGEIPSDPERAARWLILRKQQDEVLKPRRRGICNNEGGRAGQVAWASPPALPDAWRRSQGAEEPDPRARGDSFPNPSRYQASH